MQAKEELIARFGVWDYVVFAAMLIASALIGVSHAFLWGKQDTTAELLMGNKSMKVVPVSMSILASFISAITLLGMPAEIYLYGTQYWTVMLSYFVVLPVTAHFFLPVFYNINLTSAYEYLERRFDPRVRTIGCVLFGIQMMFYMAVVLYAPALALAQVTGLNVWLSVLSIGVVCTFYTTIGGIKAVVWTDVFQVSVMYISMFIIVIKGCYDVGGIRHVWNLNLQGERIEFFNFNPDPTERYTVWGLFFGSIGTMLAIYAANQAMIQRYLTVGSLKGAMSAVYLNLPGVVLLQLLTGLAGLVVYAKYSSCDPITTKRVTASDQLLPLFVMDTLGLFPGVPGLFVAGVFSGALSTVSSGVNSLATVTLEDIIKVYVKKDMTDRWATRASKVMALGYGVLCILLVVLAESFGNVLQAAMSIFGVTGGPLLGMFVLGMFFPWANSKGCVTGVLVSLVLTFWISFGALITKPEYRKAPVFLDGCPYANATSEFNSTLAAHELNEGIPWPYRISYVWYSTISALVCTVVGVAVSFATGASRTEDVDASLLCPHLEVLFPWLRRRPCERTTSVKLELTGKNAGHSEGHVNPSFTKSVDDL